MLPLIAANLGYAALVLVLAVVPSPPSAPLAPPDFVSHGLAFGLQAILLFAALRLRVSRAAAALGAWTIATGYGVAIEVVQLSRPTRALEATDMLADAVGAAMALGIVTVVMRLFDGRAEPR